MTAIEGKSNDDWVLYAVDRGVCTITLNNPTRRNTWNDEIERSYFASLDRAAAADDVRAIVVTGTGESFCPGQDSARLERAVDSPGLMLRGRRPQHHALTVPKPMIAAINGSCAGVGLVQALCCDVRFVAEGARISTAYARLGLSAEYGVSWILPRLIGLERALDLLLSARPVEAEEALSIGLVSRVCSREDLLPAAQDYAQMLATHCSPTAMAVIRRQVWGDLSRSYSEANGLWLALMRQFAERWTDGDVAEGVASLVAKRPPNFGPLSPDCMLPPIPPFVPQ